MTEAFIKMHLTSDNVRSLSQASEYLKQIVHEKPIACPAFSTLFIVARSPDRRTFQNSDRLESYFLLPLLGDIVAELVRGHLGLLPFSEDEEEDVGLMESCLCLLPDHAREHSHGMTEYNCTYFAIQGDFPADGDGSSVALYLTQTIHRSTVGLSTSSRTSNRDVFLLAKTHHLDQYFLTILLSSYWDGLELSACSEYKLISSGQCQWRGCCRNVAVGGSSVLCHYHAQLQRNSDIDFKNHICKDTNTDLMSILSSFVEKTRKSAIMKELKLFTRRKCEALRFKNLLKHSMDMDKREGPDWGAWKEPGSFDRYPSILKRWPFFILTRELEDLTRTINFATKIQLLEKQVDDEIDQLSRLRVFPSMEYATIRKQFKYLREQHEEGKMSNDSQFPQYLEDLEYRVTENKLALLRSRRIEEEEARIAHRKKMAKLRQLEESQSKDPANFRNQRKF